MTGSMPGPGHGGNANVMANPARGGVALSLAMGANAARRAHRRRRPSGPLEALLRGRRRLEFESRAHGVPDSVGEREREALELAAIRIGFTLI
jgi:hypothetical protein